jgi:hypothetical protein
MRYFLLIILLAAGCRDTAYKTDSEGQTVLKPKFPPIVFDDWWNVDYVKNGCELAARNSTPCPSDRTPREVVREFENELDVVFASESACHGLLILK